MTTTEDVQNWCRELLTDSPDFPQLEECLETIPELKSLNDLPAGTRVLVRGDLDVEVDEAGNIGDDTRLRSLVGTLKHGHERGWVQIVYGHRKRDPNISLKPVVPHLERVLKEDGDLELQIDFIANWCDNESGKISDQAGATIANLENGAVVVLENTRWRTSDEEKPLERVLDKAKPDDLPALADRLTEYANGVREKLARVHVNDAIAASNRDLSSTVVPLVMDRVALGDYNRSELADHVTRTRLAELVVFSGMKLDKLDALQEIIERGVVNMVISAGLLALSLNKAQAELAGQEFPMGLHGDPDAKKIYVPPERIEQAKQLLEIGKQNNVEFVLPVDFVLNNGSAGKTISDGAAQMDVGPATIELHKQKVAEFIAYSQRKKESTGQPAVAFHNGVFGKFEEDPYSHGTREFIGQLKVMHDNGVQVYVGGGEGGTALKKYGQDDWVTHCFTAGGTILKALGIRPIPFIKALYLKSKSEK
ncbi:MAG: phosphoglycerate kinase [Planctomycetaceae bacterium]